MQSKANHTCNQFIQEALASRDLSCGTKESKIGICTYSLPSKCFTYFKTSNPIKWTMLKSIFQVDEHTTGFIILC